MEIYFQVTYIWVIEVSQDFKIAPFESVEEMNRGIIHNFNSVVRRDDILYILGDLSYRIPESQANELIKRIKWTKNINSC